MATLPTVLTDHENSENHRSFLQILKKASHQDSDSSEEENLSALIDMDSDNEELLLEKTPEAAMFEVGIPA